MAQGYAWKWFGGVPLTPVCRAALVSLPADGAARELSADCRSARTTKALRDRGLIVSWPGRGYALTEEGVRIRALVVADGNRDRRRRDDGKAS